MSTSLTAGQAGTSGASLAILVGRILLAAMFVLAGFGKLTDIAGTAGWFGSIGLPAPTIVAVLVGLLELVAGLATGAIPASPSERFALARFALEPR